MDEYIFCKMSDEREGRSRERLRPVFRELPDMTSRPSQPREPRINMEDMERRFEEGLAALGDGTDEGRDSSLSRRHLERRCDCSHVDFNRRGDDEWENIVDEDLEEPFGILQFEAPELDLRDAAQEGFVRDARELVRRQDAVQNCPGGPDGCQEETCDACKHPQQAEADTDAVADSEKPIRIEMNALNLRLKSCMERIRRHRWQLKQVCADRENLERYLKRLQGRNLIRMSILNEERQKFEHRYLGDVEFEAKLKNDLPVTQSETEQMKKMYNERTEEIESLQRTLVEVTQQLERARHQVDEIQQQLQREIKDKESTLQKISNLECNCADLTEQIEKKTAELAAQQTNMRMSESNHMVEQKIVELELKSEKDCQALLDEQNEKHRIQMAELEEAFRKSLSNYVSLEQHAILEAELEEALSRLRNAELNTQKSNEELLNLEIQVTELRESRQTILQNESDRRDHINNEIQNEKKRIEDVRSELQNYRLLIEQINLDDSMPNENGNYDNGREPQNTPKQQNNE